MKTYIKKGLSALCILAACHFNLFAQSKAELISKIRESVVCIQSFSIPFIPGKKSYSFGTGYVADTAGLIITNSRVVKNANAMLVYSTQRDEPYYASVVWQDTTLGLAVIRAFDCRIAPLELADPEQVRQGEEILLFSFPAEFNKIGQLRVSWGLLSGENPDSTLLASTPESTGTSGGPAVNLEGKVIGTVSTETGGIGLNETGLIKSIPYVKGALINAYAELKKPINYAGTKNLAAYRKICEASMLGWNASRDNSSETNEGKYEQSKACIFEALDFDPNYGEAFYFLASYYFNRYLINCARGGEYDGSDIKDNFIKAYENAERLRPSLGYKESYLATFKKELDLNKADCLVWMQTIKNDIDSEANKKARVEDINLYIENGTTPVLLKNSIGSPSSEIQTQPPPSSSKSYKYPFLMIDEFEKIKPVRFSVCFPGNVQDYTNNIGFSIGNAGRTDSDHNIFFKNQFSFELFQDIFPDGKSNSLMILSYNLGMQAKFFQMTRINPKPYLTIGYNPALSQMNEVSPGITRWYYNNAAINLGADVDIWITNYFGLSLSYEYTYSLSNFMESVYDPDDSLYLKYSKFKIGIIF